MEELAPDLSRPCVISGRVSGWASAAWSPSFLADRYTTPILFRLGKRQDKVVQYETDCVYVEATLRDFVHWDKGRAEPDNPLCDFKRELYWCYADYKHMKDMMAGHPELLQAVDWSVFGLARGGEQSTFWLGSPGAYTVCHYDTYGFNLVAQIYGRKRWTLFPPCESDALYPTRVPYEESSVFSRVNVPRPDLEKHPKYQTCTPVVFDLSPGEVLYVPRHWWHYVECVDTAISVNTWVDTPLDRLERLQESVSRTLVCGTLQDVQADWINPTETELGMEENFGLVRSSLAAVMSHDGSPDWSPDQHLLAFERSLSQARVRFGETYTYQQYMQYRQSRDVCDKQNNGGQNEYTQYTQYKGECDKDYTQGRQVCDQQDNGGQVKYKTYRDVTEWTEPGGQWSEGNNIKEGGSRGQNIRFQGVCDQQDTNGQWSVGNKTQGMVGRQEVCRQEVGKQEVCGKQEVGVMKSKRQFEVSEDRDPDLRELGTKRVRAERGGEGGMQGETQGKCGDRKIYEGLHGKCGDKNTGEGLQQHYGNKKIIQALQENCGDTKICEGLQGKCGDKKTSEGLQLYYGSKRITQVLQENCGDAKICEASQANCDNVVFGGGLLSYQDIVDCIVDRQVVELICEKLRNRYREVQKGRKRYIEEHRGTKS